MINRQLIEKHAVWGVFGSDEQGRVTAFNAPILMRFGNPAHLGDLVRIDEGVITITTYNGRWRYLIVNQNDHTGESVAVLVEHHLMIEQPVQLAK